MLPNEPNFQPDPLLEAAWHVRQHYWRRTLGRVRLGVEPIETQLAKYRRATWVLTDVASGLGLLFFALFTAFQRPDVGTVLAGVLLAPIVAWAWLDYAVLASRARRYLGELREYEKRQPTVNVS